MSKIRIRKRGKTFSYSFDIAKKPRRMIEKGGFPTKEAAYDAGTVAYADWKSGNIGLISRKVKIKDFLAAWLENISRPSIKRSTYLCYRHRIDKLIVPYLGDKILQELRPRDVDTWLREIATLGMARSTLGDAKMLLAMALKYAVYPAELIRTNPAIGFTVPKTIQKKVIRRTVVTPEQFAAIPKNHRYYPVIKLLYHTGLRISEALGLTWDDINLTTGEIHISRQRVQHGYFESPKTATSARVFYADAILLAYLKAFKASQAEDEMRLGETYQLAYEDTQHGRTCVTLPKKMRPMEGLERRPLVCIRSDGTTYKHSGVATALAKLGLNSHSFRHTHATRLIEAGAKAVDVAARLGHADASITQNIYTHDTTEMQQETARIFEAIARR